MPVVTRVKSRPIGLYQGPIIIPRKLWRQIRLKQSFNLLERVQHDCPSHQSKTFAVWIKITSLLLWTFFQQETLFPDDSFQAFILSAFLSTPSLARFRKGESLSALLPFTSSHPKRLVVPGITPSWSSYSSCTDDEFSRREGEWIVCSSLWEET